jgi:hypothetical protein
MKTGKITIHSALTSIEEADKSICLLRDKYDMEWGENAHTDLDTALVYTQRLLQEAQEELNKILTKFQDRPLRPNFPRKKKTQQAFSLSDLPLVF